MTTSCTELWRSDRPYKVKHLWARYAAVVAGVFKRTREASRCMTAVSSCAKENCRVSEGLP